MRMEDERLYWKLARFLEYLFANSVILLSQLVGANRLKILFKELLTLVVQNLSLSKDELKGVKFEQYRKTKLISLDLKTLICFRWIPIW